MHLNTLGIFYVHYCRYYACFHHYHTRKSPSACPLFSGSVFSGTQSIGLLCSATRSTHQPYFSSPFRMENDLSMISLFLLGTLGSLVISTGVARALKLPAEKAGSFIQGSFQRQWCIHWSTGHFLWIECTRPTAEKQASVMLAPIVIIFNLLAVLVLIRCGKIDHSTQSPTAYILVTCFKIHDCLLHHWAHHQSM